MVAIYLQIGLIVFILICASVYVISESIKNREDRKNLKELQNEFKNHYDKKDRYN